MQTSRPTRSTLLPLLLCAVFVAALGCDEEAPAPIELDWVALPAGEFTMGADTEYEGPAHRVTVAAFEISRTEVTVAQYRACQAAGACGSLAGSLNEEQCNLLYADRGDHPVNCVNHDDAMAFAQWIGGRLPTEAQWEYAARSAGRNQRYPWGDEEASCDYAVMGTPDNDPDMTPDGCGLERTWPVCAKPRGNTAQGLCDMSGNVAEWVQDKLCDYESTPRDGSAADCETDRHVIRGGHVFAYADSVTVTYRGGADNHRRLDYGIRVVRDLP